MAGTSARTKRPSRAPAERIPRARESSAKMKASAASASIPPNAPIMRDPNASPKPAPTRAPLAIDTRGYSSKTRTRLSRKIAIATAKGESFGCMNGGGERGGRGGRRPRAMPPARGPAGAPADPPGADQPQTSARRAHQAAGLEQRERQKLGGKRREQIEAAAVVIEIHPR